MPDDLQCKRRLSLVEVNLSVVTIETTCTMSVMWVIHPKTLFSQCSSTGKLSSMKLVLVPVRLGTTDVRTFENGRKDPNDRKLKFLHVYLVWSNILAAGSALDSNV